MILPQHVIDDFKTNRKDITPPLPVVARLVPILFYLSIFASIVLCSLFLVQIRLADVRKATYEQGKEAAQTETNNVAAQKKAMEDRILRARDVQGWVEGSLPVQPLAVSIARSMAPGASLSSLRLTRQEEAPANIKLTMSVATTSIEQIERTTSAVSQQNFRVVQPQQSFSQGQIDYTATLVGETSVSFADDKQPAAGQ